MSMFTRTKPSKDAPDEYPLPDGYDDSTGPTYVPEQYRAAWHEHAGNADVYTDRENTIRVLAEYRALRESRPEQFAPRPAGIEWTIDPATGIRESKRGTIKAKPPHLLAEAAELGRRGASILFAQTLSGQQEAAQIMRSDRQHLEAEAEHALRLFHVQIEHEFEQRELAMKVKLERDHLCPVCKVSSVEGGRPDTREIVPSGSSGWGRAIRIHSCAGCYLVAVADLTDKLADAVVDELTGETRLDRVRAHLASQ